MSADNPSTSSSAEAKDLAIEDLNKMYELLFKNLYYVDYPFIPSGVVYKINKSEWPEFIMCSTQDLEKIQTAFHKLGVKLVHLSEYTPMMAYLNKKYNLLYRGEA